MMPISLPSRSIRVRLSLWITFHIPWVSTVVPRQQVSNSTFSVSSRTGAQASGPRSTISASSFLQDLMFGASHRTSFSSCSRSASANWPISMRSSTGSTRLGPSSSILHGNPFLARTVSQLCLGAELLTRRQRWSAKRCSIGTARCSRPHITSDISAWCTAASRAPSLRLRLGKRRLTSTSRRLLRNGWSHAGSFFILAGTNAKLAPRRSCRGTRTPLRLKRRRMAPQAWTIVATSLISSWLASGAAAF